MQVGSTCSQADGRLFLRIHLQRAAGGQESFAAHLAIVLMLHDRVDRQYEAKYNEILHYFIESVIES